MPAWLEISVRTFMAVVVLWVLTRVLGKRQVSQLSLFEYITGITIGSLAAYVSLDSDTNWWLGFLSMVVWVAVSLGMEFLQLKSKRARDLLDGKARILVENGKVIDTNMRKERITTDELLELLRRKNVFDMSQVEFAIMDTSGELSVMLKKEHQPLTPSDIGLSVKPERIAMSVIMDGRVLSDSLSKIGLNEDWLNSKLKKLGTSADRIFLAQVDSQNKLYLDPFDDHSRVH